MNKRTWNHRKNVKKRVRRWLRSHGLKSLTFRHHLKRR